jgi:hypothetical protein
MHTKYSVDQRIILARMHGLKNVPATIYEVHVDYLLVRTHLGQFVKVKEQDIARTAK